MKNMVSGFVCLALAAFAATPALADGGLPEEYVRLKWIRSTGTQLINTQEIPGPTVAVRMNFNTGRYIETTAYFGQSWDGNKYLFNQQSSEFRFHGNGATICSMVEDVDACIEVTTASANNLTLTMGGVTYTKTFALTANATQMLQIFGCAGGRNTAFTLYDFTMWRGGELAHQWVPAKNTVTGQVGLFDMANPGSENAFLVNVGTGEFEYGEEVSLIVEPIGDQDYDGLRFYEPESVTVTDARTGARVDPANYTVAVSGNGGPGKAKVTVTGKGTYAGKTGVGFFYIVGGVFDPAADPYATVEGADYDVQLVGSRVVYTFGAGSSTLVAKTNLVAREWLVVGGGGEGGSTMGGGGGGGAVLVSKREVVLRPGESLSVSVGAGGRGSTGQNAKGASGKPSTVTVGGDELFSAPGGAGGASWGATSADNGGCGGGGANGSAGSASTAATVGALGCAGGAAVGNCGGGGGGGAGEPGAQGTAKVRAGKGGDGWLSTLNGREIRYGSGGGGGGSGKDYGLPSGGLGGADGGGHGGRNRAGYPGVDGLGGGGGGGGWTGGTQLGAAGGAGTVIVSFRLVTDAEFEGLFGEEFFITPGATRVLTTSQITSPGLNHDAASIYFAVVPKGTPVEGRFVQVAEGMTSGAVERVFADLTPSTEYDWAAYVSNGDYDSEVATGSFTTLPSDFKVDPIGQQSFDFEQPCRPEPVVTDLMTGAPLTNGVHYTVAYAHDNRLGTGTATVTAIEPLAGEVAVDYTIVSAYTLKIETIERQVYRGSALEPKVIAVLSNGKVLRSGTDYSVSYQNNAAPGTGTATATGVDLYAGISATIDFRITGIYADDYLEIEDDLVEVKEVGNRRVYVFTDTTGDIPLRFKQAMTLEEALLVGGGGAGGWGGGEGSGGGGGGVVWTNLLRTVAADEELSVFVGAGGDPYANYVADSTINAELYPHGGNGAPSGLTIGADEFVAYGGGGGGSKYHGQAGTGRLGSSGGFKNPTIFDYRTEGNGLYYTLGQGFVGQIGVANSAGGGGAGQRFLHQGNGNKASGGEGLVSVITGEAEVYGSGGGGGGCDAWSNDGGPGGTHAGMGGSATTGKSINGDAGFGGGGGGGGKNGATGGRGGSGTVILAFTVGDTTSDPFVITIPRRVPYDANGVAVAPVRVTCGGETLEEGVDYDLFYYNTNVTSRAQAFALVEAVGKGGYSGKRTTARYEAVRAILVSAEATEAASGTSWATATSFADALARVGSDWEIWMKAGTYVRTSRIDYKDKAAYSFYGGFSGNDDWPDELAEDPYSIWDGNQSGSGFFWFDNSTTYEWEFIFDHIHFTHSTGSMLSRREGASLRVRNCKFTDCRSTVRGAQGIHCGSYNARRSFTICEHCLFANLQRSAVSDSALGGVALYADAQATVFLDDCTFVSNSIPLDSTAFWNRHKAGAAISMSGSSILKARRCKFVCHRSDMVYNSWGTGGASAVSLSGSCSGSMFENCLFIGNEDTLSLDPKSWPGGALNISGANASQTVTVHRCTFAYNLHMGLDSAAGLTVETGHADISDCIFYGNVVSTRNTAGADLMVKNGSATVTRSLFAAEARTTPGKYFSALDATKLATYDLLYGDPRFVTPVADFVACLESSAGQTPDCPIAPHYTYFVATDGAGICALDAHLLSPGVYYDNAGVRHADEEVATSAAILDDGTNLGCYAGTAEESLLPQINPYVEDVEVSWEGGYSQPRVTFTPGRETGSAYNAKVTVEYSVQGGETYSKVYTGVPSDVPFSALADFCLPPGATYSGSVTVEAGGNSETVAFEGTVDVPYNPSWGKGGGADKVVHVRPGATGRGTGDNWFDAMTDFHAALSHLTETRNELWLAGDVKLVALASTCSPKTNAVVRGGFAGTEGAPADRAVGTLSTIDGDGAYTPLTLANAHAITLERLGFTHSRDSGLIKSGAGDIALLDCSFTANATNMVSVNGRGARLSGTAGVTQAVVSNCVFAGNQYLSTVQNGSSCAGFGLYLGNFARAEVVDSLFVTNGVNRASAWPSFNDWNPKETMNGTAIHAASAPIFARGCRFVANLACSANGGGGSGTVVLTGAGGGSVFENCLWLANAEENYTTGGTGSRSKDNLGCLRISLSDWSDTVAISNCTIAYNIAESNYGSVGLSIHKGDVRLVNSIIWGNVVSAGSRGADIYVVSNSSLRASYSLLATNSANYVTIAAPTSDYGTVTWGPGMVYGDPCFVTDAAAFLSNVHGGKPAIPRGGSWITFGKSNEVAKALCAFNVHVKGARGYKDEATGEVRKYPHVHSPAIDAGDPASPYANEAEVMHAGSNGKRVNLGYYGNTRWSTMSAVAGSFLHVR